MAVAGGYGWSSPGQACSDNTIPRKRFTTDLPYVRVLSSTEYFTLNTVDAEPWN